GADMTPPPAPANLAATPGNAVVGLAWSSVPGASGYNVYRSVLPGGGYQQIGSPAATSFNDATVANGRRYYYVVKARDAAGNESAPSNEAAATPFFPITYAVLQFPKIVNHTAGVTPTQLIYGRVFAGGITDASGSPALIRAEIGFGPLGSNPATWTGWQPMAFNTAAANDYEYQGRLRPEQAGNFDMLVRFSTNGGLTWAYGDKDGFYTNESGTDDPGDLNVAANADTIPPAAPANLSVAGWGDDFIALAWQPVGDAALYRLYRSVITGTFDFSAPLAEIAAPAAAYTDTLVATGVRYHYVVKAFDHAFNASPASNEVSQVAEPRLVNLTFNLIVPAGTPGAPTIAGNNAQAFGQTWNPGAATLTQTGPNTWRYQATVLDGAALEYKYARGSWEKVEKQIDGNTEVPNRLLTVDYGASGAQVVTDTVANWRDPFVLSHLPAAGAANVPLASQVRVAWNQEMTPAADFAVAGASGPVSGTFAYDSPGRATIWTPAAPLAAGSAYTVTVAGEVDPNGDAQQVATVWSFLTVPAQRGLDLTASAAEGSAPAGGQVRFSLTLTNTGNVADSYALSRSGGSWTASFPATVGPLAPGQGATIQVTVDVPAGAANGASDALTLTARSQGDPSVARTAPFTARNSSVRSFTLSAALPERSGPAGSQVQHPLTLTNTGNVTDTYDLSRSGGLWTAAFPATAGPLGPGQSVTIPVTVNVPAGAANGASDTLTINAVSRSLPSAARSVQLTTRNATRRLYLPWIQRAP
ncbi:MAG TPA: Ig-like domain-containing protein, partial [Herpetosiphonaceae bacterium]